MQEQEREALNACLEAKQYKFIARVGNGGTATCFLVQSLRYNTNFVVKQMILDDNTMCKECELMALQALNSTNVICMYDYYITEKYLFLFLEYCANGSIQDILRKNGPLKGDTLVIFIRSVLNGIEYIHSQKCAHSDIKPANILIDRYGRVKIADFGLSRVYNSAVPKSHSKAGSLIYMAPEIFIKESYDPFAADIWALGVTFYIVATGKSPFPVNSYKAFRDALDICAISPPQGLPPQICKIIMKMLNPNPERRPKASELLKEPVISVSERKSTQINSKFSKSLVKYPALTTNSAFVPTALQKDYNPNVTCSLISSHKRRASMVPSPFHHMMAKSPTFTDRE